MRSIAYRRAQVWLIFAAVFTLFGACLGGYLALMHAVSTEVEGRVSRYEYDEHGHPSLVIEFADPQGRVGELRTFPDQGDVPEAELGTPIKVLVPPAGFIFGPTSSQAVDWFIVGLWTAVGVLLLLLARSDLQKASTE